MKKFDLVLVIVLAGLLSSAVLAEVVPTQMNFQGILTDTGGNPISDSTKSVQFTIYDAVSGGNMLWAETLNVTTDSQGRFTVILGLTWPLYGTVFSDTSRYLGVQVGNDAEISPRAKISSSAYSLRTRSVNGAIGGTIVGGSPGEGAVLFMDNGSNAVTVELKGNVLDLGGGVYGREENGDLTYALEPDFNGAGGFFSLFSDAGGSFNSFFIDGNASGTGEPFVGINGTSRSVFFDVGSSGNSSVALPGDAISAPELLDEPGVASHSSNGSFSLGAGNNVLSSRSITAPTGGYVLVVGSCNSGFTHSNGTASQTYFGVSNLSNSLPPNQDQVSHFVPSSSPTGQYGTPVTVHGLFSVTAGLHTFYLLGDENFGVATVADPKLTLLFLPTAYGTVSSLAAVESAKPDQFQVTREGLTQAEIEAEQSEAKTFNQARIQKELEQMQAQLDAMKKQLAQDANFKQVQTPQNK
ncbi:MAG: hypothetical protein A2Z27_00280 [candidate division Zixibacteria bacterium RBG_16_50_21]|nr:MAG: hypothetical protein A2Z27_00280 [candidate division Zixibacteria bacterium RBG_16_50_21]